MSKGKGKPESQSSPIDVLKRLTILEKRCADHKKELARLRESVEGPLVQFRNIATTDGAVLLEVIFDGYDYFQLTTQKLAGSILRDRIDAFLNERRQAGLSCPDWIHVYAVIKLKGLPDHVKLLRYKIDDLDRQAPLYWKGPNEWLLQQEFDRVEANILIPVKLTNGAIEITKTIAKQIVTLANHAQ